MRLKSLLTLLHAILLTCALIPATSLAQNVSKASFDLRLPGGASAHELYFSLYDGSNNYLGHGKTSNGIAILPADFISTSGNWTGSFPEAAYSLRVEPSRSHSITDSGLIKDSTLSFTVNKSDANYNAGTDTYVVPLYTLSVAERWFKLTLREGDSPGIDTVEVGTVIPGYYLTVIQHGAPGTQFQVKTNSEGIAYVPVPVGDDGAFDVCAPDDPESTNFDSCTEIEYATITPTPGAVETSFQAHVRRIDSSITVSLSDVEKGGSFVVPESQAPSSVECGRSPEGHPWFYKNLNPGESGGTIEVPRGDFNCYAFIENHSSGVASVTVTGNSAHSITVPVFSKNSQVKLRAVDESGNLLTGVQVQFTMYTDPLAQNDKGVSDTAYGATSSGELALDTINNLSYQVSAYVTPSEDLEYIVPDEIVSVTAPGKGEIATADFTFVKADATLRVRLLDPDGAPAQDGYVEAYSSREGSGSLARLKRTHQSRVSTRALTERKFYFSKAVKDGYADIRVKSGYKLTVASISYEKEGGSFVISPEHQQVTLAKNEVLEVALQSELADHTLSVVPVVSPTAPESASSGFDFTDCSAYNIHGQQSYSFGKEGITSVALPLLVGKEWEIVCHAVLDASSATKFYTGHTLYTPEAASASLTFNLSEAGTYLPQQSFTFDASKDATFLLSDNETEISIPAGAFGSSGTITMQVWSAVGITYSADKFPVFALNIKFLNSQNQLLSEPSKAVAIRFAVDEEDLLKRFGVTPDKLQAATYDEERKIWRKDGASSYDPETKTQSIFVGHFSIWGQLTEKSIQLKAGYTPTGLSAKKLEEAQFTLQSAKKKKKKKKKRKKKKKGDGAEDDLDDGSVDKLSLYELGWIAPVSAVEGTQYEVDLLLLSDDGSEIPDEEGDDGSDSDEEQDSDDGVKDKKDKKGKKGKKKKKKKKRKGKKKKQSSATVSSEDLNWSQAQTFGDISGLTKQAELSPGRYAFRVRMKGRTENSDPFEFQVE